MDRKVRRQTQVADALRYSLLPRELPGVPGVEVATTHLAATENPEVGGDSRRVPHLRGLGGGHRRRVRAR